MNLQNIGRFRHSIDLIIQIFVPRPPEMRSGSKGSKFAAATSLIKFVNGIQFEIEYKFGRWIISQIINSYDMDLHCIIPRLLNILKNKKIKTYIPFCRSSLC